ncbi:MAG: LacI family transcriptional regulator [Dictyoglomus sp. NZ13-RE01]|nr:MAG: LacI family transcriptional regulator [Dictyoglomus sp. NZ13-RE01]
MSKKLILLILVSLILSLFIFPTNAQAQKEVVVVVKIAGIPWFNRMAEGVQQAGKELGIKASLIGPSTADAAPQVSMVEDLITRGVDAICVVPTDAKALKPTFKKARSKGIVILTHESPFEVEDVDYDIETIDSVAYGKMAINEIVLNLSKHSGGVKYTADNPAGFVMFVGGLTVPLHNFWADVALNYVKESVPFLKELTPRLPVAESVEDSRKAALDLIRTYGNKLKAIIGWGSLGPLGAARAVRELGMQHKVIVGGSAIPSTAVDYLRDGSMDWAQLWDPKEAGYMMVYIAKLMMDKKQIVSGLEIPNLGPIKVDGKVISVNRIKLMRTATDAKKLGF